MVFKVDSLAGRAPQAQVDPVGLAFSVAARSQVHSPTGRAPIKMIMSASMKIQTSHSEINKRGVKV